MPRDPNPPPKKRGRPRGTQEAHAGPTAQQNFRLGDRTLADLDAIASYLSTEMGREANRSDAIRWAAAQARKHLPP